MKLNADYNKPGIAEQARHVGSVSVAFRRFRSITAKRINRREVRNRKSGRNKSVIEPVHTLRRGKPWIGIAGIRAHEIHC